MNNQQYTNLKEIQGDGTLCGEIEALVSLMRILREPGGCPWDRKQTYKSLRPYLLEETYEVIDCIDKENYDNLREELGDLLLQIVFQAQIASEEGRFTFIDNIRAIREKLIQRHPHVFGEVKLDTAQQVRDQWERIKLDNHDNDKQPKGTLGGVPRYLPALTRAFRVQEKMAGVGFDWEEPGGAVKSLREEVEEFAEAIKKGDPNEIEEEIGDILFSVVNTARLAGFGAEEALRRTTEKVIERFTKLEARVEADRKSLTELSLDELDAYWNIIKDHDDASHCQ